MTSIQGKPRATTEGNINKQKETNDNCVALKLRQLKERLRPLAHHQIYGRRLDLSDVSLSRWLKTSGYDVFLADAKIRKCLEFREQNSVDSLMTEYRPPECIYSSQCGGLCSSDKQGSPVYYELYGLMNTRDVLRTVGKSGLTKFKFYQHERIIQYLKKLSRRAGKLIDTILVVVDLQLRRQQSMFSSELLIWAEILELLIECYPCLIKEIVLINGPPDLTEDKASLKPYLSQKARQLITVLNKNLLPGLFSRISRHNLPAFLGGDNPSLDKHGYCILDVDYWNMQTPEWMRLTDVREGGSSNQEIAPATRKILDYLVPQDDSLLTWSCTSHSLAIDFMICMDAIGDMNKLFSATFLPQVQQKGHVVCRHIGRYLVIIDNRRNLHNSAVVSCNVKVTTPKRTKTVPPKLSIEDKFNVKVPVLHPRVREDEGLATFKSANTEWLNTF